MNYSNAGIIKLFGQNGKRPVDVVQALLNTYWTGPADQPASLGLHLCISWIQFRQCDEFPPKPRGGPVFGHMSGAPDVTRESSVNKGRQKLE